jgi:ribulose kinase
VTDQQSRFRQTPALGSAMFGAVAAGAAPADLNPKPTGNQRL